MLAEHGRELGAARAHDARVIPEQDPEAERERLARAGVLLRNIPDRPWLRASVGAWNDERDLERLLSGART